MDWKKEYRYRHGDPLILLDLITNNEKVKL
jgi:hypothetical protein